MNPASANKRPVGAWDGVRERALHPSLDDMIVWVVSVLSESWFADASPPSGEMPSFGLVDGVGMSVSGISSQIPPSSILPSQSLSMPSHISSVG